MKLPASQALFAYWHSLRKGRSAPDRHDLDPAAMRGVLSHTFMLETDRPESSERSYVVRLSGTRLDALFGRALKGTAFPDLWSAVDRAEGRALLGAVLDDTQPVVAGLGGAPAGYDATAFELLLLPLRHHGRTHSRVLGSLVPFSTPTWIGLRPLASVSLRGWRAIDRRAEAEAVIAAERAGAGGRHRRAHLVVHEGGRQERPFQPAPQVRVKAAVPGSSGSFLSTRRS